MSSYCLRTSPILLRCSILKFVYPASLPTSVAEPDSGSGAFLTPGSGIRCLFDPWIRDPVPFDPLDPGRVKTGSGSGMNNPDHISESLETIFRLKYLNSLMRIRDLGSGIRDKHPGSAILLPKLNFFC